MSDYRRADRERLTVGNSDRLARRYKANKKRCIMKLTEKQRLVVEMISHPDYSVSTIERYYKENSYQLSKKGKVGNESFYALMIRKCDAFMDAVDGIIKTIIPH